MSQFSGRQGEGAMKTRREVKRLEAEERNAATPPERRKAYRRQEIANAMAALEQAIAAVGKKQKRSNKD